ncbi:DUF551 domain-containing protein [Enterococcus faecalis]
MCAGSAASVREVAVIPGASWKPSHWMPLPEPPQEAK